MTMVTITIKPRNRTSVRCLKQVRVGLLFVACSITIFLLIHHRRLFVQGYVSSSAAAGDGIAFINDNPTTFAAINRNISDRQFLNFDEAGPTPLFSRTNRSKGAVPERRWIPPEFMEDIQFHLRKKLDSKTTVCAL